MKKIMEMLQNMKAKKEQKDNRGFSLVELIIVIAIFSYLLSSLKEANILSSPFPAEIVTSVPIVIVYFFAESKCKL